MRNARDQVVPGVAASVRFIELAAFILPLALTRPAGQEVAVVGPEQRRGGAGCWLARLSRRHVPARPSCVNGSGPAHSRAASCGCALRCLPASDSGGANSAAAHGYAGRRSGQTAHPRDDDQRDAERLGGRLNPFGVQPAISRLPSPARGPAQRPCGDAGWRARPGDIRIPHRSERGSA